MPDPLMRALSELAVAEPDVARAERLRARCHAHLARQSRRASQARNRTVKPTSAPAPIWRPAMVVLGVAYLTEAIGQALRVFTPR